MTTYSLNITNVTDTLTGTYVAVAGVIISVLAHYNIVVTQDSVVAVLAGIAALYGVLHQVYVSYKATGSLK